MLVTEIIDLSVAAPAQTNHLSIASSQDASFMSDQSCWEITQPNGNMQFNLNLPDLGQADTNGDVFNGVALTLQFCSDITGIALLTVKLNDTDLVTGYQAPKESEDKSFSDLSWYLPESELQKGANLVTIILASGAPLLLKSLTIVGCSSVSLNGFQMQQQNVQMNWCWLVVAASVSAFYDCASIWTQCKLANACLNLQTCCPANPEDQSCNTDGCLENSLGVTKNLANVSNGKETLESIRAEIKNGNPLCIRIIWKGNNNLGHFIALTGVGPAAADNENDTLVTVEDPLYGFSLVPYSTLTASSPKQGYRSDSIWTDSYFTKNPLANPPNIQA